jgi:hypothetical protein
MTGLTADKIKIKMDALARCPHPTFPHGQGKGINRIDKINTNKKSNIAILFLF